MNSICKHLPAVGIALIIGMAVLHGPVAQLPNYHQFADQMTLFGIPHFCDVLSNIGFALIALWQWLYRTPASERWAFAGALLIYLIAKLAELNDHEIANLLGAPTGHTLKHLLATAAAALILYCLIQRMRSEKLSNCHA